MGQDVDQSSERIAQVEPPDAPRLSRRAVLDPQSRSHRSLVNLVDVVDLDRDVWYGSSRTALGSDADLRCSLCVGRKCHDPPEIHDNAHSQDTTVKSLRSLDPIRPNIRYDSRNCHLISPAICGNGSKQSSSCPLLDSSRS